MFVTALLILSQSAADGATNLRQVWVDQLDPTLRPTKTAIEKGLYEFPRQWVTDNDYPTKAMREGKQGTVYFTVQVNTAGLASSCAVTRSSGSEELDQATCPMIQKRARFKPATDDNGNPREGSYSSSVAWRIPKD